MLYNESYTETMKRIDKIDFVLTDPPYPDYLADEYLYHDGIIDFLKTIPCTQLIFWTAKENFPLDYTAIHIWDKITGAACAYERVFERNGGARYKLYRGHRINSTVSAQFAKDTFQDHPSQKPLALIRKMILEYTKEGDTVFDPFAGSGTTAVACLKEKRKFIGAEINNKYFDNAMKRIEYAQSQTSLF